MSRKKKDLFYDNFIGEFIMIITDESGLSDANTVNGFTGFLLDADEKYYYLGHEPNAISQAVPVSKIRHVSIVDQSMIEMDGMPDRGSFN